jgi:hypothetical protein
MRVSKNAGCLTQAYRFRNFEKGTLVIILARPEGAQWVKQLGVLSE